MHYLKQKTAWRASFPDWKITNAVQHPHTHLPEHPAAEDDLEGIVDDEKVPNVVRFAVAHEVGPPHLDDVDVAETEGHGGHGTAHEEPSVHPLVATGPQVVVETQSL